MAFRKINHVLAWMFYFVCSLLLALPGMATAITFTAISGPGGNCTIGSPGGFCNDVGIDYSQLTGNLITSEFPNGSLVGLFNVDRITGIHTPVANAPAGSIFDETKVATVRVKGPACSSQSFPVGTIIAGTGNPGEIIIIPPGGPSTTITLTGPSVSIGPGTTITEKAVLRGGFFQDRFCAGGTLDLNGVRGTPGDLFVVSGDGDPISGEGGNVWRVTPGAVMTHIAQIFKPGQPKVRAHLEGVIVVPNDPDTYGPWAGKIVTGDEDRINDGTPVTAIFNGTNPKIYAVDPTTGSVLSNGSGFTITGPVPQPRGL
jgi:hypothetical protein